MTMIVIGGEMTHPEAVPAPDWPAPDWPAPDWTVLAAERVVTPEGLLTPGWIAVEGDRIAAVGAGKPSALPAHHVGHWALPGFIDMHVHGGGGGSFTDGGPDDARMAAAFHRAHGTTRIVASLVTAPLDELERRAAMLADLADEGIIDGIHLEGPFLSPARCGAQNPRYLVDPDTAAFDRLLGACRGWLRMITIAPELPGAPEVIRAAADAGVIAAAGHTDASAEVTDAAVTAGISHATHLFSGMRPIPHRAPGPAAALLDRQVTCEIIADGTHLHDITVRLAARAAGRGNLVLITDAMSAAGMPDGSYRLGELDVTVSGGVARLSGSAAGAGAIAGSTATMDLVVRRAIAAVGLDARDAAAAASTTPARRLGLAGITGALRPGLAADIVLLDEDFQLRTVMARGRTAALQV
jgi:N-acetylglucosamine-6-phosphate deacetylase